MRRSLCVLECGGWRGTGLTPLSRCDPLPYFRACRSLRVPSPKRRGATLAAALQDGKRVGEPVRRSLCVLECGGWRGTGLTPLSRCGSFSYFRALPKFAAPSPKRRRATLAAALQDGKRGGEHVRTSLCVLECGGWRGTGLTPLSRCGSFSYFRALPKFAAPSPKRRRAALAAALQDGKRVGEPTRRSLCVLECGGWRGIGLPGAR